nr:HlyD family secretion protein [Lichenibacterium sp. 6Y81]
MSARALKLLATALILAAAAVAALLIWNYYVTSPWTRDGRVRVQVANVAPQVSGQITEIRIIDNQFVHKGDVLYVIDPFDFKVSLQTARATVKQRAADLQVKRVQAERRQHLSNLATTPEEQQQYVGNATQAEGAFEAAQAEEAQAEINLKRTEVTSPVNGFVTNLQMRVGDFAHEGTSDLSVIDADSFWVDGYFEETKMARVCVGDAAQAALMGYAQPLLGHVQSVTRGISVSDAASSTQGLPNVDAVYTWVRLAQRVPVRMKIDHVPPGVPLVSGMTATVSVRAAAAPPPGPWWRAKLDGAAASLRDLVDRPAPRTDCVPAVGDLDGRTVTLPTPEPSPPRRADQINPGLTPGMTDPPRPR